jgi:hypothetical protein
LWEVLFVLLVLKIPVAYVGWIIWWAIKAEPEIGAEGEPFSSPWKPWRHPSGSRPDRKGPHGARATVRAGRRRRKAAA